MTTTVPSLLPPEFEARLDAHLDALPEHCRDGLRLYLCHGVPTGGFLTAVLSNDLKEACARADETNRRALFDYVTFLYNYAPAGAWGSEENVTAWVKAGAELRKKQASTEHIKRETKS